MQIVCMDRLTVLICVIFNCDYEEINVNRYMHINMTILYIDGDKSRFYNIDQVYSWLFFILSLQLEVLAKSNKLVKSSACELLQKYMYINTKICHSLAHFYI